MKFSFFSEPVEPTMAPPESHRGGNPDREAEKRKSKQRRDQRGKRSVSPDGPSEVPSGMEAAMMAATGTDNTEAAAASIKTVEKPPVEKAPEPAKEPEVTAEDAAAELDAVLSEAEPAPVEAEAAPIPVPEKPAAPAPEKSPVAEAASPEVVEDKKPAAAVTAPPPPPKPATKKAPEAKARKSKVGKAAQEEGWKVFDAEKAEKEAKADKDAAVSPQVAKRAERRAKEEQLEKGQKKAMEAQPDLSENFGDMHQKLQEVRGELEAIKARTNADFVAGLPQHDALMRSLQKVEPLLTGAWEEDPKVATHLAKVEAARIGKQFNALQDAVAAKQAELWSGKGGEELQEKEEEVTPKKTGWWNVGAGEGKAQTLREAQKAAVAAEAEAEVEAAEVSEDVPAEVPEKETAGPSPETKVKIDKMYHQIDAVTDRLNKKAKESGMSLTEARTESEGFQRAKESVTAIKRRLKAIERGGDAEANATEIDALRTELAQAMWELKSELPEAAAKKEADMEVAAEGGETTKSVEEEKPLEAMDVYDRIRRETKETVAKMEEIVSTYPELKDEPSYGAYGMHFDALERMIGTDGEKIAEPFKADSRLDILKRTVADFEKKARASEVSLDLGNSDEETQAAREVNREAAEGVPNDDLFAEEEGKNLFAWGEEHSREAERAKLEHVAGRIATLLEEHPGLESTDEYKTAFMQIGEMGEKAGSITPDMEERMQEAMMALRSKAIAMAQEEAEAKAKKETAEEEADPLVLEPKDRVDISEEEKAEAQAAFEAKQAEGTEVSAVEESAEQAEPAEAGEDAAASTQGAEALAAMAADGEKGDVASGAEGGSAKVENADQLFGMKIPTAGPEGWIASQTFLAGIKFAVTHKSEVMSDPANQQRINELRIILEDVPAERGLTTEQVARISEIVKEIGQPERVLKQKFARVEDMYAEVEKKVQEKIKADLDTKSDTRKAKRLFGIGALLRLGERNNA